MYIFDSVDLITPENEDIFPILRKAYDNFDEIVAYITSNEDLLENVNVRSYDHNNGFKKIVLYQSLISGYSLRLHIWDYPVKSVLDIHNHAWDFHSIVIKGSLKSIIYEELESESSKSYQLFKHKRVNNEELLIRHRETKLCIKSEQIINQRTKPYCLKSTTFHKIVPLEANSCTLVLQSPKSRPCSEVALSSIYERTITQKINYFNIYNLKKTLLSIGS